MSNELSPNSAIPIRNVWLLMLYAADARVGLMGSKVQSEAIEEGIPDLVGGLLCDEIERRYRNKFSLGYMKVIQEETRLRGRIKTIESERLRSSLRGKIVCQFDRLTHDTATNRYALRALRTVAKFGSKRTRQRCHSAATLMIRLGVSGTLEDQREPSRFAIDRRDQRMVALAKLALEMNIPSELSGNQMLFNVERNEVWLRQLYEKAIGGFYRFHLDPRKWHVETSKILKWPMSSQSSGFDSYMPTMKTDIEITNLISGQKTVIDTKFTSFSTNYKGKDRFKSGHLYQIYAYLRSQEDLSPGLDVPSTRGMLLYPEIGSSINESAFIQNHHLTLVTVDLTASTADFKANLLALFPN